MYCEVLCKRRGEVGMWYFRQRIKPGSRINSAQSGSPVSAEAAVSANQHVGFRCHRDYFNHTSPKPLLPPHASHHLGHAGLLCLCRTYAIRSGISFTVPRPSR